MLNGGGHNKALRSYGAGRDDRRARLFLSPAPNNADPGDVILQAAKHQLKTRRSETPLIGWESVFELPPD
eukprot:6687186-Alexandrium_andersonii.AAC.1